jgi:hypothetical protein
MPPPRTPDKPQDSERQENHACNRPQNQLPHVSSRKAITQFTRWIEAKGYADDVASSIEWLGDLVAALASDLSKHGPGVGVVCPDDWPFGSRHLGD